MKQIPMTTEMHHKSLIDTLIAQNATLSGRVSQLESENSSLRIQHAGFERYFSEHRRDLYRRHRTALYGIAGEPAAGNMGDILTRREAFLRLVSDIPGCESLLALHPHNGMGCRYRVLLLSAGGMGDCLILTYLAALVRAYLPVDYLAVGFESKQVKDIFADTALADAVISLNHETRDALFSVATAIDIFDIVIDVRYAAVAFFPPQSRVPLEYQLTVRSFSEPWFKYNLFDWPHLNHHFANAAMEAKLTAYSLFPHSLALGNVRMSPVMDIEPSYSTAINELLAFKKPIVCLGIGSDAKMASDKGLSTKTIPLETVNATVEELNKLGYLTVQLGMSHEPMIESVAVDLRGRLAVRESAAILKLAVCFVGVEGGLVHMAKAVGTPSVVSFGPTPAAFFGYDENVNISTNTCTPCWWTTREWMTRCISQTEQHGCMKQVSPADLVAGVRILHSRQTRKLELAIVAINQLSPDAAPSDGLPDMGAIYPDIPGSSVPHTLVSSYVDYPGDSGTLVLKRNNVPHALSIKRHTFIDGSDLHRLALQVTNLPNILDAEGAGTIVVGRLDAQKLNGLSSGDSETAFREIICAFTAKGHPFKALRPKKLSSDGNYYITIKWAAE